MGVQGNMEEKDDAMHAIALDERAATEMAARNGTWGYLFENSTHQPEGNGHDPHTTHKIQRRTHIHTTCFDDLNDVTEVRVPTKRECSCRGRFADRQRCSSQALWLRESIVERTDGSSGEVRVWSRHVGSKCKALSHGRAILCYRTRRTGDC